MRWSAAPTAGACGRLFPPCSPAPAPRSPATRTDATAQLLYVAPGAENGLDATLDIPPAGDALKTVANRIGGSTLQLDITSDQAPQRTTSSSTTPASPRTAQA